MNEEQVNHNKNKSAKNLEITAGTSSQAYSQIFEKYKSQQTRQNQPSSFQFGYPTLIDQ